MKCTEVCQQYLMNAQSGMGANVHAGIDEDTDAHADVLNHTTAEMTALRDPERRGERATQEREDRETALLAKAKKGHHKNSARTSTALATTCSCTSWKA